MFYLILDNLLTCIRICESPYVFKQYFFRAMYDWLHYFCGEWEGWALVNWFNHTSWVTAVTPTYRPKSVRNSCVMKDFGGVFVLSRCFLDCSVGVGLSQDWVRSLPFSLNMYIADISKFIFNVLFKKLNQYCNWKKYICGTYPRRTRMLIMREAEVRRLMIVWSHVGKFEMVAPAMTLISE